MSPKLNRLQQKRPSWQPATLRFSDGPLLQKVAISVCQSLLIDLEVRKACEKRGISSGRPFGSWPKRGWRRSPRSGLLACPKKGRASRLSPYRAHCRITSVWHRLTHAYGPGLDVSTTLKTKPSGESPWSVRTLARHLGVSRTMVHRVWQRFDVQPHRVEKLKLSNDPQFEEKVQRYRGLLSESPRTELWSCVCG